MAKINVFWMHRKIEEFQKEKSKSRFDFENIGTLIRWNLPVINMLKRL